MNIPFASLAILLIIGGLCSAKWPRASWYLENWWKYERGEPSDLALVLNRAGGVIAVVFGVVVLILAIVSPSSLDF